MVAGAFFMDTAQCLQKRTRSVRPRTVYLHAAAYKGFINSNFCFGIHIDCFQTVLIT